MTLDSIVKCRIASFIVTVFILVLIHSYYKQYASQFKTMWNDDISYTKRSTQWNY